jgi:hypothetical protein
MESEFSSSAEHLGSGDGERKASMIRLMLFEPLPASVLLGVAGFACCVMGR